MLCDGDGMGFIGRKEFEEFGESVLAAHEVLAIAFAHEDAAGGVLGCVAYMDSNT